MEIIQGAINHETITFPSRGSCVPSGLDCYLLESVLQVCSTLLFAEALWL